jgi:radical SAM superfamily enzyme YgiQ (UPF0313 family)
MTDVLFTHSYFLRFDPKEERANMPYPPLGTLYAAAAVRQEGFSVTLFDSMLASSEDELVPFLQKDRPRVVVIYDDDFNYLTKMCLSRMREAAFRLTELARRHGAIVIVHGSDPVDHAATYLARGASYVVLGEGESTLRELLAAILRGTGDPLGVPGIAALKGETVYRSPARPVNRHLDDLPFPAWDLTDIDRYRRVWMRHHGWFSMNIVTTRGCPFHCNWCAKPLYGQTYTARSPQNVFEEIRKIRQLWRPDHLWFCDDIFGLKPGWIEEFSSLVTAAGVRTPFKCLARVDLLLRDNAFRALRKAGCESVWVGAESGSQKILDAMEKGTTVDQIREATQRLHREGIRVGFFLQFGYPGETADDIDRTLRLVRETRPDDIGVSVTYPLPGTKFFVSVREQMGSKTNWVNSDDLALLFRGTYSPDFYRVLHRVVHKQLRLRQGGDILAASVRRPWTLTPRRIRGLAAALYHSVTLPGLERRMRMLREPA